jgi:hypothetical protein
MARDGSKSTAISGFRPGVKNALPASAPKFAGITNATVAFPLRTASRAAAGSDGFTSS